MRLPSNLNGSWDAFENRRKSDGQDPKYISPENLWEFNYLVDMILADKPNLDHISVILSVRDGMRKTLAPRPRQHFVDLVMDDIRKREMRWEMLLKSMDTVNPFSPAYVETPFSTN